MTTAALALLAPLLSVAATAAPTSTVAPAAATAAPSGPVLAAKGTKKSTKKKPKYTAKVVRTKHGIPHITAKNWGSLGFGSGYAAAEASICNLVDTLITGRGERSLHFGEGRYDDQVQMSASNLEVDVVARDLRQRKVVETLLADEVRGPSPRMKKMVAGYTAGLNAWLAEVGGADGVTDPECAGKPWVEVEAKPLDLWYGVYFANLLASTGVFVKEIVTAAPASLSDPGLPEIPGLELPFGALADKSPAEIKALARKVDGEALRKALGRDDDQPFGSNATAIGKELSTTGQGMILGNPHFPWRGRYRFSQQHLTIPGKYDVAGASLIGSPAVNIGWNKDVAWSHTVSTAYRFTPYEFLTVPGTDLYVGPKGPKQLKRSKVEVPVRQADGTVKTVQEDVYRTEVGYVIDAPDKFMPWGLLSLWSIRDANAEHLRTMDSFLAMGEAKDVNDLLAKQDKWGGIPWVNTIAADRKGNALYADHSVTPNITNQQLNRCLTPIGILLSEVAGLPGLNGALPNCGWKTDPDAARPGIVGPARLPDAVRTDWVANANDSYWLPNPEQRLEGYPKIMGCEKCERTLRTRMVYAYPAEFEKAGRRISPKALAGFQHQNRVMGAEVMRADGALDAVCRAADGGAACDVLAAWDGRSDASSVGNHIFEAFIKHLPEPGLLGGKSIWKVPFDAADPMHTPRGLDAGNKDVVAAMRAGLAELSEAGVPVDAPWGRVHVAGDRGAPAIGLGGGSGAAGNANVVEPYAPEQNASYWAPVAYGSSHVQSVAFKGGKVVPRTILTYGQFEDPSSPWSSDQTRLFGAEKWVRFPWTAKQVKKQKVSSRTVSGG